MTNDNDTFVTLCNPSRTGNDNDIVVLDNDI